MNKFAKNLSHLLKSCGVSQDELAKRLNVKQQTVSRYAGGVAEPSFDILIEIAKFFDVSADYLLGIKDDY